MAVKDVLKSNVPDYVKQTPEWPVFLRWISQKKIKTSAQLKSVLNDEIKNCQNVLDTSMASMRLGTHNRIARNCAKKLDFLKLARDRIVKYL